MALISWIVRFLLILFVVRLVLRLFRGTQARGGASTGGGSRAGGFGGRGVPGELAGGHLVRDPQCGTYVAESSAIKMARGGETFHFCSDRCRDAYAAAHATS